MLEEANYQQGRKKKKKLHEGYANEMTKSFVLQLDNKFALDSLRRELGLSDKEDVTELIAEFCLCYSKYHNRYDNFQKFFDEVVEKKGGFQC